jgi:hypothetical protein
MYFNIYILRQQTGRQKFLNRMVAGVPRMSSELNSFKYEILIFSVVPKFSSLLGCYAA